MVDPIQMESRLIHVSEAIQHWLISAEGRAQRERQAIPTYELLQNKSRRDLIATISSCVIAVVSCVERWPKPAEVSVLMRVPLGGSDTLRTDVPSWEQVVDDELARMGDVVGLWGRYNWVSFESKKRRLVGHGPGSLI